MLGAEFSDLLSGLSQAIHNVDHGRRIPMASPGVRVYSVNACLDEVIHVPGPLPVSLGEFCLHINGYILCILYTTQQRRNRGPKRKCQLGTNCYWSFSGSISHSCLEV